MDKADIQDIYSLCSKNVLYYKYCPPFVTEQSIICDMIALPPGKEANDKYYVGYYDADKLIAVMDLIMAYPDEHTAFIGFFMMNASYQGKGEGSDIVNRVLSYISSTVPMYFLTIVSSKYELKLPLLSVFKFLSAYLSPL